jgi:hypothetical protein
LGPDEKNMWEQICAAVNHEKNYANYTKLFEQAKGPFIPCYSILLHQLELLNQSSPDTLPNGSINFLKWRQIGSILKPLKRLQRISYSVLKDQKVQQTLKDLRENPELVRLAEKKKSFRIPKILRAKSRATTDLINTEPPQLPTQR